MTARRQNRMIDPRHHTPEVRADMTLSLAAVASGEVPWVAWQIDDYALLILSDDYDVQLRDGISPEVPERFAGAHMFSLAMFREVVESLPRAGDGGPRADPW